MSDKMLITKLVRKGDVAHLFGQRHRFKDLILFDLSDLALVDIDYTELQEGVETPCRFWALFTVSKKLNGEGNPYKDIAGLEPFTTDTPQPEPPILTDILSEIRAIRALLHVHVDNHTPAEEPPASMLAAAIVDTLAGTTERRYTSGHAVNIGNPAEEQAYDAYLKAEGGPPSSVGALRKWVLDTPKPAP